MLCKLFLATCVRWFISLPICRSSTLLCCSLLVSAIVGLYTVVFSGSHLLLVDHLLVLTIVVLTVLVVLLICGLHLLHSTAILGLLVNGLHVVSWGQHLVSTHRACTCT